MCVTLIPMAISIYSECRLIFSLHVSEYDFSYFKLLNLPSA